VTYTSPGATGSLSYTPVANQNGSATITVTVKDDGLTAYGGVDTRTRMFTVTVTAVNDAPSFTKGANQLVNEDSGTPTGLHTLPGWATLISSGPSNESTQVVGFSATNDNNGLFTAGGQPTVSASGTLTYTSAANAYGSATVTVSIHDDGGTANGGQDTSATQTFTITITSVNDAPSVASDPNSQASVQYSDAIASVIITANDIDSPATSLNLGNMTYVYTPTGGTAQSAVNGLPSGLSISAPTPTAGTQSSTPGVFAPPNSSQWTISGVMNVAPGTYAVTVPVSDGAAAYNTGSTSFTITVIQENASLDYTGETVGLTGSTGLSLRATVWDSAAVGSGFTGDSTIGDITKMYVQFDIYTATNCGGTPTATKTAPVLDTGTSGDGIGTATSTYTSSSEASYCVIARLIGSTGTPPVASPGSSNVWYQADPATTAVVTFYNNTGQFVTGGGWILDPGQGGNGHGNFGFNARFSKSGSPQGQMVYVYRGLYTGGGYTNVLVDYRIKSNALTSLGFSCWNGSAFASCPVGNATFPARATLSGKSSIQINRASDGLVLYSDGNSTFNATVADSGNSSGIGTDSFAITVYDKNSVLYKQVGVPTPLLLQGGNVVIHGTAN